MKKKIFLIVLLFIAVIFTVGCEKEKTVEFDDYGYYKESNLNYVSNQQDNANVKNIILIIGDGMGENQVKVTEKYGLAEGQKLDILKAEYRGLIDTNCLNNYVTDSAAAATAFATGVRTNYKRVGMDADGNELSTILDYAASLGKKTGVITTDVLNGATPLAFTAHGTDRYLNGDELIKSQLNSDTDILMGFGEADYFEYKSLIESNGYTYTNDRESMNGCSSSKMISVFNSNSKLKDKMPTLPEMAKKTIDVLSKNDDGFVLVIEEGQIDKKCDAGEIDLMMDAVISLDKTLRVCLNFMRSNDETLVIVLADHETGGLVMKEGTPDSTWFTEEDRYHTNVKVPVYAFGTKSKVFDNCDILNSEIYNIMKNCLN